MPLNISTSPMNIVYNPIFNPDTNNFNFSHTNTPLLISSIFSNSSSQISSVINYDYEDNEMSNMEEGILIPNVAKVLNDKKNSNLHLFSFSDKGKKIKKITL